MECQDGVSCLKMELVCYFPPFVWGRILKKKRESAGFWQKYLYFIFKG